MTPHDSILKLSKKKKRKSWNKVKNPQKQNKILWQSGQNIWMHTL